jgi:hypothetical protein
MDRRRIPAPDKWPGTGALSARSTIVARLFQNIPSGITRRPSLPNRAPGTRVRSSSGVLTEIGRRRNPMRPAAISALGSSETEIALFGFAKTACPSPEAAVECARQMALLPHNIGAVAFTRSGYPAIGWYEEAEVLKRFGEI